LADNLDFEDNEVDGTEVVIAEDWVVDVVDAEGPPCAEALRLGAISKIE